MINSMTGFGRGSAQSDGREMAIELKSVNHRYLDVGIRLPRSLIFLEDLIRKTLSSIFSRGHLDVFLNYRNTRSDSKTIELDKGLLLAYEQAVCEASEIVKVENDVKLSRLLRYQDVLTAVEAEDDREAIAEICEQALRGAAEELLIMRQSEGKQLELDFRSRLAVLKNHIDRIEARAPQIVTCHQDKMRKRIEELLNGTELDRDRLENEVAYFADHANIDEEIVRFNSHLVQYEEMIDSPDPVGRKLDFLVQELNRECNTIGSKASDSEISRITIEIKAELEKIREQVQNIE